jgi:valyl-tRNA synthetase
VDAWTGTGALKITPRDVNDMRSAKRVGLEFINILNKDATMNENAGAIRGALDR